MMWIFGIVIVLALGVVAVVAAGRGEPMSPAFPDRPDVVVPSARELRGDDVRAIRFNVGFRGYRAAEVDALLARVAAELDARSTEAPQVAASDVPAADEAPSKDAG